MRTVEQAANEGNEDANFTIEIFCYKAARYIASLGYCVTLPSLVWYLPGYPVKTAPQFAKNLTKLAAFWHQSEP